MTNKREHSFPFHNSPSKSAVTIATAILAIVTAILVLSSGLIISPSLEGASAYQQQLLEDNNNYNNGSLSNNNNEEKSGNYFINYIYDIEVEKPALRIDKPLVAQGGSFYVNGTNFDKHSTIELQAFEERKLMLSQDEFDQNKNKDNNRTNVITNNATIGVVTTNLTNGTTIEGLLLVPSNDIALEESPAMPQTAIMIKKQQETTMNKVDYFPNNNRDNGTITLVVKLPNSLVSKDKTQRYSASLQCQSIPSSNNSTINNSADKISSSSDSNNIHNNSNIINLGSIIFVNGSSSTRRFLDASLPAGNYVNCEIDLSQLQPIASSLSEPSSLLAQEAQNESKDNNNDNNQSKENLHKFKSGLLNFTVTATDSTNVGNNNIIHTNKAGSFMEHIRADKSISPNTYVLMARQSSTSDNTNGDNNTITDHIVESNMAIAAFQVMQNKDSLKYTVSTMSHTNIINNNIVTNPADNNNNNNTNDISTSGAVRNNTTPAIDSHHDINNNTTNNGGSGNNSNIPQQTEGQLQDSGGNTNTGDRGGAENSSNSTPADAQQLSGQEEQQPTTIPYEDNSGSKPQELCSTDFPTSELSNYASLTNSVSNIPLQSADNVNYGNNNITITQKIMGAPPDKAADNVRQHVITSVDVLNENDVTQSITQKLIQKSKIMNCFPTGHNSTGRNNYGEGDSSDNSGSNNYMDGSSSSGNSVVGTIPTTTYATNSVASVAIQDAYNIYEDTETVKIQQTIIIPKYCTTDIYAPITVQNRNTITQTINQEIIQKNNIKLLQDSTNSAGDSYAPGTNLKEMDSSNIQSSSYSSYIQKNIVTQFSIQGASNIISDSNVLNIKQAIIVPGSCNAYVHAPILVQGSSNVKLSIDQKTVQVSTIKLVHSRPGTQSTSSSPIAIANAITTNAANGSSDTGDNSNNSVKDNNSNQNNNGGILTNTILHFASQNAVNAFYYNNHLEVTQQIYYVNNTAGWGLNYEQMISKEFPSQNESSFLLPLARGDNQTATSTTPTSSPISGGKDTNASSGSIGNNNPSPTGTENGTSSQDMNQTKEGVPNTTANATKDTNSDNNKGITSATENKNNNDNSLKTNPVPVFTTTITIGQSGLQDASNDNRVNSDISSKQQAVTPDNVNATSSTSNTNDVGQSNKQKQSEKAAIVNDNSQQPSNTITSDNNGNTATQSTASSQNKTNSSSKGTAAAVNNDIGQTGMQLASNYNEQNSNGTISQGVIGNPVNAGIDVYKGNNVVQEDTQKQNQNGAITTITRSTTTT